MQSLPGLPKIPWQDFKQPWQRSMPTYEGVFGRMPRGGPRLPRNGRRPLRSYIVAFFCFKFLGAGWDRVHLVRRPHIGVLYQPLMIDDECGAVCAVKIGRGNRRTRRKPAPVPLCPPQIPHDLTWARTWAAAVGSRLLTAWAMSRSTRVVTTRCSCDSLRHLTATCVLKTKRHRTDAVKYLRLVFLTKNHTMESLYANFVSSYIYMRHCTTIYPHKCVLHATNSTRLKVINDREEGVEEWRYERNGFPLICNGCLHL
jgi:hypothetical protein